VACHEIEEEQTHNFCSYGLDGDNERTTATGRNERATSQT
jgi:hypothetical protein